MDEYREGYPKRAERTLFIPRTADGQPNKPVLDTVREFEQRLSVCDEFIGVTLWGSSVRGYHSAATDSDIDLSILFDKSLEKDSQRIWEIAQGLERDAATKFSKTNAVHTHWHNVSTEAMQQEIEDTGAIVPEAFVALSQLSVGRDRKVKTYRERAGTLLKALSPENKKRFVTHLIQRLIGQESDRWGTAEWRITDQHGDWDKEKLIAERKRLWETRVHAIFAL